MGSMVCSVTSLSPGFRYCPGLTVVMPSFPANGARMVFLSISACCCATCACLLFKSAASASTCALDGLDVELRLVAVVNRLRKVSGRLQRMQLRDVGIDVELGEQLTGV